MSDDEPLLSKMDALLKKHRGGGHDTPAGTVSAGGVPPPGWLPVLTQVIERGTPPAAAPVSPAPARAAPAAVAGGPTAAPAAAAAQTAPPGDALAEQLMRELAPRLSAAMEAQVAAELRKNLDQTLAGLLDRLDADVREIVRAAIAEKLAAPRERPD